MYMYTYPYFFIRFTSSLQSSLQNLHQGYPDETLVRFLKARDWNVPKAYKMVGFNFMPNKLNPKYDLLPIFQFS